MDAGTSTQCPPSLISNVREASTKEQFGSACRQGKGTAAPALPLTKSVVDGSNSLELGSAPRSSALVQLQPEATLSGSHLFMVAELTAANFTQP